jgi:hypothetical protein
MATEMDTSPRDEEKLSVHCFDPGFRDLGHIHAQVWTQEEITYIHLDKKGTYDILPDDVYDPWQYGVAGIRIAKTFPAKNLVLIEHTPAVMQSPNFNKGLAFRLNMLETAMVTAYNSNAILIPAHVYKRFLGIAKGNYTANKKATIELAKQYVQLYDDHQADAFNLLLYWIKVNIKPKVIKVV